MPKRSQSELQELHNHLVDLIRAHPKGLSRSEIRERYRDEYGEDLAPRSLRRWLKQLIGDGRIRPEGEGPTRVYCPPGPRRTEPGAADEGPESGEPTIPLSEEGAELQRHIRQPRGNREPVTFNRDFLDSYDPESPSTWYLPAKLREKFSEIGQTPDPERPAGTYAREILEPLLIDLSWSSSRLEGNTYSRADTEELIKEGKEAEGKDPKEAQMILNHKAAIEHLVENPERSRFNRLTILTLHARLAENLMGDPAREGNLRTGPVSIGGSTYTPTGIPQVIVECFDTMLGKAAAIPDPFEQSFFIMVHLPYLQPFWDVNKRTARIAANIPLFKQNLIPLSFIDVPRDQYLEAILVVYELNRVELLRDVFEWAYHRSCKQYRAIRKSMGEPPPDPIRLRYREELGSAVREMVRRRIPPRVDPLRAFARENDVAPQDIDDFAERATELLRTLNEGTAGRHGIELEELEAWRAEVSEH